MDNRRYQDGWKLAKGANPTLYRVRFDDETDTTKFTVEFKAPNESVYRGFWFDVAVELEEGYPHTSCPTVNFKTKILHPNIEDMSGFPCHPAFENENWNAGMNLEYIFNYVLPDLLCSPNTKDPYNTDVVELFQRPRAEYEEVVQEHCKKYAVTEEEQAMRHLNI